MNKKLIDWTTFIGSLVLLITVTLPLVIFPKGGKEVVLSLKDTMTSNLSVIFLAFGLGTFTFLLYLAYSRFGDIQLGKDEKPEFSTLSWAAMLFCAGIGASILYWAAIEWVYYYTAPPLGIEPESSKAMEWASAYGIFHWGLIPWGIFTLPAVPIAYFYYVRKKPVLKISEACRPILGDKTDGPIGKLVDILFLFGLLGGAGTTLGLAMPLIGSGINDLTGIETSKMMKAGILIICTAIFGFSAFSGLKKGIRVLSDMNLWLSVFLLGFIFLVGPTLFMAESTFNALGIVGSNFLRMSTWTEPFNNLGSFERTGFPESWTVFFWAWWLVFAPFVGLFVARISRGRTVRQLIVGTLLYGTLGSIIFFGILGNYAIYLEMSGQYGVVEAVQNLGPPAAVMGILNTLPMGKLLVGVFVVLAVIFTATTFDSGSYIIASVVQKEVKGEPLRWNRLFWAFALSILPIVLMYIGGLSTLQTASIVGGVPLLIIMPMLGISFVKAASYDFGLNHKKYKQPEVDEYEDTKIS
ncbi:BCCT family transporter [Pontibacillus marinus]|uniref:Choline transporter BetT n=1 Tax=Pontibacillus marinus BH030004 = DSM 16465 TaxID=1385511 RepID=A0A0A5G0G5_9BACI|nr:BCCT family transporter [Pontibacillus marinus]KGX84593.1 choline transporter BetT [Pontibacillus marinus BH030004 = DSM 16465]